MGREKDIGAAKINDGGVNVGVRGRDVNGAKMGEDMEANEGVEGVERGGDDVKGCGGRRKRVNPAVNNQVLQRPALRGRRRGVKAAKAKEDKSLSLYMEQWLDSNPRRSRPEN